ncbi:MAG TPA: ATP-binding protein [Polyangiaceae bacterium]|nr:ATP-binding protein [Polyangiaceae bacterium]
MHQRRRKTLQGKLLVVIVAAVLGAGLATFAAFGWTSTATERERLADIERQIRETISSKAEALATSHAFALRGLVEDNAIGDVRQLVGHAVSRDEDVIYGLFVSAEGQLWAYASPDHANVDDEAPPLERVLQALALAPSQLTSAGAQRRSLHAFGQDLEEFRVNVTAEDGTSLGNLLYGFGNERTRKAVALAGQRSSQALAQAFWLAGAAGVISLLLAMFWALRSAARLTAPVAELTAKANAIASGQRGVRADIQSGDEVEVLAAAFNQMQVANEDALAKLEATTERALAADRLKSEFLANMSHEIRTPMNGVLGMSKLILSMPIDSKLRRYVATIDASASALLTIINDVLDFSKMEAGKYTLVPCKFELAPVLQDVLELLASRANDKGIELISRIEPGLPAMLIGDPDRFRQVLNNLVGNAVKFTEHGEVFVEVTQAPHSSDGVLVVQVAVTDTGIGIDPADVPKLYEAFSQLDGSLARRHGGTGLGLAISKRLVELMGGEMKVQSEPGRGSTFSFTARFGIESERRDVGAPVLPEGTRVLLVEPQRHAGEVLLESLRAAGVNAERCETGARALSLLREAPPFSVVIMNRDVGDRSADDLASAIRGSFGLAAPRLVLLNTRSQAREPNPLFSAELPKPVRFSELCDCLSSGGQWVGRALSRAPLPTTVAPASRRVLVIDDNEVNRFVVVEHLEQRGYITEQAIDGRDAFEKFRANEYACLLMDCQMPVMDGYAATRAIRNLERELGRERTPIIALTAHALAGERERVLDAGMDDFLSKPFRPSILDGILRRYSERDAAESHAGEHPVSEYRVSEHDSSELQAAQESRVIGVTHAAATSDIAAGNVAASNVAAGTAAPAQEPAPLPTTGSRLDLDPDASRSDKLIRLFLERMPQQLAELGRAVEAGDTQQIRALSHKIKGSSLALAAPRMSETAAEMQHQAEAGNLSPLPLGLRRLQQQYGVVADSLEAELARRTAPSGVNASRNSIT